MLRLDPASGLRRTPEAVRSAHKYPRDPNTYRFLEGADGQRIIRGDEELPAYSFYIGNKLTTRYLTEAAYPLLIEAQSQLPVMLCAYQPNGYYYWMFRERVYRTTEVYETKEALALLIEGELKKRRRLGRAMALLSQEVEGITDRTRHISEEVRLFVWRRDEGVCVKCKSQEQLEFDHVIPLSRGGSNTARNVQLLCAECNGEKSDGLY